MTTTQGTPYASMLAPRIPVKRHDRADRQVDSCREDHERHADRKHHQEGVVEKQRRHVAWRQEVAKADLGADQEHHRIATAAKVGSHEACLVVKALTNDFAPGCGALVVSVVVVTLRPP